MEAARAGRRAQEEGERMLLARTASLEAEAKQAIQKAQADAMVRGTPPGV
jgi:hypothetical protein|eukprot:COSAG01_NODE_352_length_18424_cov_29.195034_8_plen_50_part_00